MGLLDGGEPKGFIDLLPDPMKPSLLDLGVVAALVILMVVILRSVLFNPLMGTLDQRDRDINAGSDTKAKAASLMEERQAEYQARLKELRAQAFAHRKSLADAAAQEKQVLLEAARSQAGAQRTEALSALRTQQEAAKGQLMAQVEALSESMVQHLLKQA